MKQFLILLLLGGILLSCSTKGRQDAMNVIRLELEGQRYDSIHLALFLDEDQRKSIKGLSEDGYNWDFFYPDSIYECIYNSYFYIPETADSVVHTLCFDLILQSDTMGVCNYNLGRYSSLVKARYLNTHTDFVPMTRRGKNFVLGILISDRYEISTDDQILVSSIKALHYGYGIFGSFTYEETMQRDMEFIRQYPDSRYMIANLSFNLGMYKSKTDVAKVFNCFSEELQQSPWGQKINKYLSRVDTVFINQTLPVWDTGILEEIVQDSSKFNLIIFSASWCQPCIRQIPVLKEIYHDLEQKLVMTYISVDEERSAENWREKMHMYEIPWRSLMVLTKAKRKEIYDDYELFGVPHILLVHPNNMKKEKLDLFEEEDRQRLYELLK